MSKFHNRLDPNTAHVWAVDLDRVDGLALADYRILLSDEELDHSERFRFDRDRCAYLVSYALLRTALTWVVPAIHPKDWIFARASNGRPEINKPDVIPKPRFNISHTTGLVACVVTAEIDCGVDVEAIAPLPDLEWLSRRTLAPSERARIAALPNDERLCGFFRLWTLKEAYAKARGLGVSLPFERLHFDWHKDRIRFYIDPTLDDGGQWYFEQWQAKHGYVLSVAVRRGKGAFLGIVRHTAMLAPTPLLDE